MNKDDAVSFLVSSETNFIFAIIAARFPAAKIPLLEYLIKWAIGQVIKKPDSEAVLLVEYKFIDWEQVTKANKFNDAKALLAEALKSGDNAQIKKASEYFDEEFRNAIRLSPK